MTLFQLPVSRNVWIIICSTSTPSSFPLSFSSLLLSPILRESTGTRWDNVVGPFGAAAHTPVLEFLYVSLMLCDSSPTAEVAGVVWKNTYVVGWFALLLILLWLYSAYGWPQPGVLCVRACSDVSNYRCMCVFVTSAV